MVARKGRTLITENRLGIVQAASGIDGSNVAGAELALLPDDPDASAPRLRTSLRNRLGVDVAVVVTDTMGRAWRNGQTDAAIGSAGLAVLHGYAGTVDTAGQRTTGDRGRDRRRARRGRRSGEGQTRRDPGRGGPRLSRRDDGCAARDLMRSGAEDLFWLGTAEAIEQGRREALLLRRSVRNFSDEPVTGDAMRDAVARALTAPAPHHTRPVRFVWLRDRTTRIRLLDTMRDAWRADLAGDGRSPESIERRVARGDILVRRAGGDHSVLRTRRRPRLPRRAPASRRADHVHRRGRRRGAGTAGRVRRRRDRQLLDRVDDLRARRHPRGTRPATPTGARSARSRSATHSTSPRDHPVLRSPRATS